VGGISGLADQIKQSPLGEPGLHAWEGLGIGGDNPLGANWIATIFGLGFVLSFGYWTTNFAEVQRALSANNMSAARRTWLITAYPKIFIPAARGHPRFGGARDDQGLWQRVHPGHHVPTTP